MNRSTPRVSGVSLGCLVAFLATSVAVAEVEPNAKRGQVYFKLVCTVCHVQTAAKSIPPSSRSMNEWRAYLDADKHDVTGTTNPSVRYYVSRAYRDSVQDTNKAAKKFLDLSDEQIAADVRAFAIKGAKDSDTPATCN